MTTLTEKFANLEQLLVEQNTAILAALTSLNTSVGATNTALEILNENGAANTKSLLSAISQNNPCTPCPLPPLALPPLDTDEQPFNSSKCKRSQAFVHAIHTILGYGDLLINGGIFSSPSVVYEAIGQAITALGNLDSTPLPSWSETVVIGADIANYIVNNVISGYTFVELFEPMETDLVSVIFNAPDAASAQSAYLAYVAAHTSPSYAIPVFNGVAYQALWNYYFSPGSTPNLDGYSGTACVTEGEGCTSLFSGGTFTGTDINGPYDLPVCDYVRVGCAGGGGGTIGVYFDGAFRDSIPVDPAGHDRYYTDIPDNVRIVGASTDDYFLVVAYCFGAAPENS